MEYDYRRLVEWLRHKNTEVYKYLPFVALFTTNPTRNEFNSYIGIFYGNLHILLACLLFWNWYLVIQAVPSLECAEDGSFILNYM
jgi:hypothetical protein